MAEPGSLLYDFIKLQDGADDSLKNAAVTNLAGGWTNHQIDQQLLQSYRDVVNSDIFLNSNKYSASFGFSSVLEQIINYERTVFHNNSLQPDQILLGHSATNLLSNALKATLTKGDTVLLNRPYYPNFVFQAESLGAHIAYYDTVNEHLENTIDEASLIAQIKASKCKVYLVCLPDNPLGFLYSQQLYNQVAAALKEQGGYLVIDYSYKIFTYGEMPSYYGDLGHDNVIAINSFSKSFVSMGRRFGYVMANRDIIDQIKCNQLIDLLCPDSLHQIVFREYLKIALRDNLLNNYLGQVNSQYKKAYEQCRTIIAAEKVPFADSKNGIYFYIRLNRPYGEMLPQLDERQIRVLPGKLFGHTDNYMRISIGPLIGDTAKLYSTLKVILDLSK